VTPGNAASPHGVSQSLSQETDICHISYRKIAGEAHAQRTSATRRLPPPALLTEGERESNRRSRETQETGGPVDAE